MKIYNTFEKTHSASKIQAKVRRAITQKKLPKIYRLETYHDHKGREVCQFRWGWDSQANPKQRRGAYYLGEKREAQIGLRAIRKTLPTAVRLVLKEWDKEQPLTESEKEYADGLDRPALLLMGLLDWHELTDKEQAEVLDYTGWDFDDRYESEDSTEQDD